MFVLYVILLAFIQGILEFLPVSSFGHLCVIQELLGMDRGPGVLLEVMLHFGTLAAIVLTFRKGSCTPSCRNSGNDSGSHRKYFALYP